MSTASIRRELINKEEGRMRNSPGSARCDEGLVMNVYTVYVFCSLPNETKRCDRTGHSFSPAATWFLCWHREKPYFRLIMLWVGEGDSGKSEEQHDTSILGFISKMRPFFLTTEPSCETYAQFMYRQHTLSDACIYPSTTGQFFLSVRLSLFIVTAGVYQLQWHTHKGIIPNTTCVCDREQQREFKPHCFVVVTNMCFKMLITWKGGTLTSPSFIVLVRSSDCDVVVSVSYHCWRME